MNNECTYCGSSWHIQDDHVIAQSKGGVRTVPACANCNTSKGDKPLMEWLRWMKVNDRYRWDRILSYNYRKRHDIALKVQQIRDES